MEVKLRALEGLETTESGLWILEHQRTPSLRPRAQVYMDYLPTRGQGWGRPPFSGSLSLDRCEAGPLCHARIPASTHPFPPGILWKIIFLIISGGLSAWRWANPCQLVLKLFERVLQKGAGTCWQRQLHKTIQGTNLPVGKESRLLQPSRLEKPKPLILTQPWPGCRYNLKRAPQWCSGPSGPLSASGNEQPRLRMRFGVEIHLRPLSLPVSTA